MLTSAAPFVEAGEGEFRILRHGRFENGLEGHGANFSLGGGSEEQDTEKAHGYLRLSPPSTARTWPVRKSLADRK
jgi:hypothetical protein